jgi:membrane-anchored mycosin MYCP
MSVMRAAVVTAFVAGLVFGGPACPAAAISAPSVDPAAVPPDDPPGPDQPMKQRQLCAVTGVLEGSDLGAPPAAQAFMNLPQLWLSAGRGAGVPVAVIDTGISPSPRLSHLRGGGDYVVPGGDGLSDCDSHGTVVASIIAGAQAETDGFSGVAQEAELISIRQSSAAFSPENPPPGDAETDRRAGSVATLARAVVHAANMGAKVINMSVVACIPVLKPVDQAALGAALRYAAVDKDAVLVAAAGNLGSPGCEQNPDIDATRPADARNWAGVVTISAPAWFSDYVLSVSATGADGQPAVDVNGREISLAGPWVGVGAPGVFVDGLNDRGELINATMGRDKLEPMSGTSFAAAYVSGLATLVRSKYPNLSAAQVIQRIESTAHSPAAVIDNRLGYGVVDPIAALNYDVPLGERLPAENLDRPLVVPAAPPPEDRRPMWTAIIGSLAALAIAGAFFGVRRLIGKGMR